MSGLALGLEDIKTRGAWVCLYSDVKETSGNTAFAYLRWFRREELFASDCEGAELRLTSRLVSFKWERELECWWRDVKSLRPGIHA